MASANKLLEVMRNNPKGVRFEDAVQVATEFFGAPRSKGTSHHIFRTPWPGDPRVNLQRGKDGKAYQIKQLLLAIELMRQRERR